MAKGHRSQVGFPQCSARDVEVPRPATTFCERTDITDHEDLAERAGFLR